MFWSNLRDNVVIKYINDTRWQHLLSPIVEVGFDDVFILKHETDIGFVKEKMGHRIALLGIVAPFDFSVRGELEEVYTATMYCLERIAPSGGMILSFDGSMSPRIRPENIDDFSIQH